MQNDLRTKSQQLLEALANSIHDRTGGHVSSAADMHPFCFSVTEVNIVEEWLSDIIEELEKPV
jgi:hypothetical protein